jgi:hypothetical protein
MNSEEYIKVPKDLIKSLIQSSGEYNGHYQLNLEKIDWETLKVIHNILQDWADEDYGGLCSLSLATDMSGSIYFSDYWSKDKHPMGHRDKLMMSFDKVEGI